ncbi:MAG TPA: prevent-host-death protein [Polyangia bacterium]|nr:prevent-host-death protein [Polyangia bacterium]
MRSVGVKLLKNRLSEYIRLAATGETVLVTDRDEVVAELGPPRSGRASTVADALLADAVRKGWVAPPVAPSESPPRRQPVTTWRTLQRELADDRGDER